MKLIKTERTQDSVAFFIVDDFGRQIIINNNKRGSTMLEFYIYSTGSKIIHLISVTDTNINMTYRQLYSRLMFEITRKRDAIDICFR